MNVETFAKMRALQEVSTVGNQHLIDHFLNGEHADELRTQQNLKRIQFDTGAALAEKLDQLCNMLDCSKRAFLEMAVIDAIKTAEATFHETYQAEMGEEYGTRIGFEVVGDSLKVHE